MARILVVDDESRMRKLVKDFLTKKNFQVLEAGDGEEAMDSVWLEDENGERQIVRASDRMLYDRHLDEGSLVTFDEKHQLTAWFAK